jgi:hypothetical protein
MDEVAEGVLRGDCGIEFVVCTKEGERLWAWRAAGLFIWEEAVLRFMDRDEGLHEERLKRVLNRNIGGGGNFTSFRSSGIWAFGRLKGVQEYERRETLPNTSQAPFA